MDLHMEFIGMVRLYQVFSKGLKFIYPFVFGKIITNKKQINFTYSIY